MSTFKRAVAMSGEFLLRIGRKAIKTGCVALTRNAEGNLCRVRIEGKTDDGQYLYGQGQYLPVRLFGREWRLQVRL